MLTLLIKKEDGSEYWKERFDEIELLKKWLSEEQTRPYWNNKFTYEIIDSDKVYSSDKDGKVIENAAEKKNKEDKILAEKQKIESDLNKKVQAFDVLSKLKLNDLKTIDDCANAIIKLKNI